MSTYITAPRNLVIVQNNMTIGKSVIPGMILCKYSHGTGFKRMVETIKADFFGECVDILFNKTSLCASGLVNNTVTKL